MGCCKGASRVSCNNVVCLPWVVGSRSVGADPADGGCGPDGGCVCPVGAPVFWSAPGCFACGCLSGVPCVLVLACVCGAAGAGGGGAAVEAGLFHSVDLPAL